MTNQNDKEMVAVVLSGGGAYAAYEIGAMRAILEGKTVATSYEPLVPDIYTGTSAGALNAALMTANSVGDEHQAVEKVARIWLDELAGSTAITDNGVLHLRLNPMCLMNVVGGNPWEPLKQLAGDAATISESMWQHVSEFLHSKGTLASRAVELLDLSSMICNFPLEATLRRVLDLKHIRESKAILRIAATNWTTGQLQTFCNADFDGPHGYAAIEASAAIPGIFSPVVCGEGTYVDGGLIMNTPMKPAIDCGATQIHIIYVDPDIAAIPIGKLQSTFAMFDRSLAITFAARTNQDIENARWINHGLALARSKKPHEEHTHHEKKTRNRTAAKIHAHAESDEPHRQLTVHRYHPKKDLGGGVGLLDFSRRAIQGLIDRGYEETMRHDCLESGCVLPV